MPLRRWMREHTRPGWYSWLVVIGGCLISMVISVTIAVQMNSAALARERHERAVAEQKEIERRAQSKVISCAFIDKINSAYQDQKQELSGPGLSIAAAWADLARECR